ncbi:hypothetical protein V8F06_008308 [Rhypophila decipiens]
MRESAFQHTDTLGCNGVVLVGRWRVTSDSLPKCPIKPPWVLHGACPSILRRKEETTGQELHHGRRQWGTVAGKTFWRRWPGWVSQVEATADWTVGQDRVQYCLGTPCCFSSQADSNENGSSTSRIWGEQGSVPTTCRPHWTSPHQAPSQVHHPESASLCHAVNKEKGTWGICPIPIISRSISQKDSSDGNLCQSQATSGVSSVATILLLYTTNHKRGREERHGATCERLNAVNLSRPRGRSTPTTPHWHSSSI